MKWYIWLALGLVLVFIIWFATKKSKTSSSLALANSSTVLPKATSEVFNPWTVTKIS